MLQHVEELDRERNLNTAFRIDALFLVGKHCMVAIVMLNKDLFFFRRFFDVIAMIMAVGNDIEVGGGGAMNVWPLYVRRWTHSRDGLMTKTVNNVVILMSYCFLSNTLDPQEVAAICVVESSSEDRYLRISARIGAAGAAFVEEFHLFFMFLKAIYECVREGQLCTLLHVKREGFFLQRASLKSTLKSSTKKFSPRHQSSIKRPIIR